MNTTKIFISVTLLTISTFNLLGMYNPSILKTIHDARLDRTIIIKQITDNFDENESVSRSALIALFKKYPDCMDGVLKQYPSFESFLTFAWAHEKKDFEAKKSNAYFVHAVIDGKPVGYLSFEVLPDGSVYGRYLTVNPAYQSMGIGKHLASTIFMARPEVTTVRLITRRTNLTAIAVYKHLGCVEGPIVTPDFKPDPTIWVGLEFTKK